MIYCFYFVACLGFLLLQTTLMPALPLMGRRYDLLIPFVIYLGAARPARESVPIVFFLGFSMDSLSGAPFGLYLTTYFWLFAGVKGITQLIQIGERFLIGAMIVAAGVLIENFIFFAIFLAAGTAKPLAADRFNSVIVQVLWAVGTGPLVLMICKNLQLRLVNSLRGLFYQRRQQTLP
jgi:rod shape-determining protein MreD